MFYQIFFSPQCAITTYRHGMYDLPHNLQNDLRLEPQEILIYAFVPFKRMMTL